jgi:hypothetical protein
MSKGNEAAEEEWHLCCANCGIAGVDDVKLEECNDCDLVKYCSDDCREEHREEHDEECKKRQAELYDKKIFTQPDETHLGECPLCFLPLPIDIRNQRFIHAAATLFAKDVFMPITRVMETIAVHSVERWQMMTK